MSDCHDCEQAARAVHHQYAWSCSRCRARYLSRRPEFAASRRIGRFASGYAKLLDLYRLEHDEVTAACADDRMNDAADGEGSATD